MIAIYKITPTGNVRIREDVPAALVLEDPRDNLKMVRETLAVAESALEFSIEDRWGTGQVELAESEERHLERLRRLIADVDLQRPLDPDGKHGERHTPTCGCEDRA